MRISDIAKAANVSTATISRVINEKKGVSDAERERIKKIIEEYNYQPNLLGQTLRRATTNTLLAILPTLSNSFYSEILVAMEEEAVRNGYVLLICEQNRFFSLYLDRLKNKLVDGIVLFYSGMEAQQLSSLAQNFPIVQCCEIVPDSHTSTVSIDNRRAGADVADMLLAKGHRHFVFVCGNAVSEMQRHDGFLDAIEAFGLCEDNFAVIQAKRNPSSNVLTVTFENLQNCLQNENHPTAVFCTSDELAIQVIQYLERRGYRVPEDISVVGFDDQSIMRYFRPRLTTVGQDKESLGCSAIQALVAKINDIDSEDRHVAVHHWIEQRETVTEAKNR